MAPSNVNDDLIEETVKSYDEAESGFETGLGKENLF